MTEREKIIEAMKTIKTICEERNCSNSCPFYLKGECYITFYSPALWEINDKEIWRAYIEK